MRRAARPRDDHLEALASGALRESVEAIGRPVRRDHLGGPGDAELVQHVRGAFHGRPVGAAAHDDGDGRRSGVHGAHSFRLRKAAHYTDGACARKRPRYPRSMTASPRSFIFAADDPVEPYAPPALGEPDAVVRLKAENAVLRARLAEAERLADHDALIPVLNRRAFSRELARTIAYCERYGAAASLVFFDLDGFKAVNDAHGHAAGDAALRAVAEVLTANVRDSDLVGRLGGDEFGVILAQANREVATIKAAALAGQI